jgi:hypothetical protein
MAVEGAAWDFFVSYTQADRAWAEWIAWTLEEDEHRVLVQAWDFVAGGNWIQSMQEGVQLTERTIAVLSDAYLKSEYGTAEWQAAWREDPVGAQRKLLPVRVGDCDRPGLLGSVNSIDVFGMDEAKARARLRRDVAAALDGRTKPKTAPPFPGAGRAITSPARFPAALPSVWKAPARNPNFVGREQSLKRLEAGLTAGSPVTVHAIQGMGGVGKTQLATEYAYRKASMYDVVWWVDAEEAATIPDQFSGLAGRLGLELVGDPETQQVQLHGALREVAGWLLIFDNADDARTVRPWLPSVLMPPGIPGHVIVTTRRGGFRQLGEVFDLDLLGPEEAVALVLARAPSLDHGVVAEIAKTLDYLPLALEQAAAYLDRTRLPADEYLTLLRTRTEEMLNRGESAYRDATLATVWALSFERLEVESPAAMQLLGICAYMAPESIPLDLFTNHPDLLPAPLSDAASDTLAFNEAIAALVDYSLAKRTDSGLQVHRLVQAALRAQHNNVSLPRNTTGTP